MSVTLKVLHDTYFKLSTDQAVNLDESQRILIKKDQEFEVHSNAPADNNHVRVALLNAKLGAEGRNTWYIFADHIEINGNEPENQPKDEPEPNLVRISTTKTGPFKLPGYSSTFYLSDPILPGGNFSWAEATKNGTRLPVNKSVVDGIIKIAKGMQEVRAYLGNQPITVNSWYRDPVTNRRIGGAPQSRHLSGDAVDFVVQGISPREVNRRLESFWGNRGGLASASVFTHIDARGYRARWSYGF
jgi:hypothetical protein